MTDLPHPDDAKPVDWRAELTAGGALTLAQLQALHEDPTVPSSLRELIALAREGFQSANWMLGVALNAGTIRLRPAQLTAGVTATDLRDTQAPGRSAR